MAKMGWVPVGHTYNPSYLRGRDWEDHSSRPKVLKISISSNGWAWWHTSIIPVIVGNINRRITVQAGLGKN
jgi:hypothetical protein